MHMQPTRIYIYTYATPAALDVTWPDVAPDQELTLMNLYVYTSCRDLCARAWACMCTISARIYVIYILLLISCARARDHYACAPTYIHACAHIDNIYNYTICMQILIN